MGGRTIWLVGMMGAGKSRVGPALARRLGCRFVDSDAEVEREAGCSVAELFAREGEAGFRRRERRAIEAWAGQGAVVALGGGAVAQPGAREVLEQAGTLVYLRARPETLLARLGAAEGRPLLAGTDRDARLARLRALLVERAPHYEAASVVVDTDELGPEAVLERVADALEAARS